MKKLVILAVLMFSGVIFAQEAKPVLEPFGKKVKATYFHENGQVMQEGYFVKGKLEGKWVSYDENGNKIAIAEYKNGKKVGKWFFWTDSSDRGFATLSEVDYSDNRVASVKNWKKDALVNVN